MMVEAHQLDAIVLLGSYDKIVPAMLMAAARLDLPAIRITGGPLEGGCEFDGRFSDCTSLTEGLGMLKAGKIDESDFCELEDLVTPTCGSCPFLRTANTMCCVAEAMGLSLPGSVTIPATFAELFRIAQQSGRQIVELCNQGITARRILNQKGIENGIRVSAAIGGLTNVALHIPAIGYEADCEITMDLFEELCRSTPHVARMNPAPAPISGQEIHDRLAKWQRPEPKFKKGYLALYSRLTESADNGAIIRNKFE